MILEFQRIKERAKFLAFFPSIKRKIFQSELFDSDWYVSQYPDLKNTRIDPIRHYILYGMHELRAPSAKFDPNWYVKSNPDVMKSRALPLMHYINFGMTEGRQPIPPIEIRAPEAPADLGVDPSDARVAYLKRSAAIADGEWVLFVTHTHTGGLKANVEPLLRAFSLCGVQIFLVVAADRPVVVSPKIQDLCAQILVRQNSGYDFAAWSHVLRLHPELFDVSALYFANDSVFGPASNPSFQEVINRIRASSAGIVGLTESFEYGWHVQSYFLCFKPTALSDFYLQEFFNSVRSYRNKETVILRCELKLSNDARKRGLDIEVLFEGFEHSNPTIHSWDKIIGAGFPFIKASLLKGAEVSVDLTDWRSKASSAGFDLEIIDAVLSAKQELAPVSVSDAPLALGKASTLLTQPLQALKVAFYGPWNFSSGLGIASRGLASALRLTGVQLNLHPVKQGFHIHHRTAPSFDICDFEGDADLAIVHLNPEAWRLLTDDQRVAISRARRVIGYWVWEMAHLPDDWVEEFTAVDRVWTPSAYCADVFRQNGAAFVDVIPHVVPVKSTYETGQRAPILRRFGLPDTERVILFVFDGSSYLVRKNPGALVRAFTASGLATQRWSLVLKTKHLMERPKEGAALKDLVAASNSVTLIDAPLDQGALDELFATADIYASPHASEGFGLTIAEAMAAGKVVVATDFGGSRDFLDETTGFPVAAKATALEETFGHYRSGGVWGMIDEADLARALIAAAKEVRSETPSLGLAAQRRIASQLSSSAVAKTLVPSLLATLNTPARAYRSERLSMGSGGISVSDAAFGPAFNIVSVSSNGGGVARTSNGEDDVDDSRWVVLAPQDVRLAPTLPSLVENAAAQRPDVAIFYGDDVAFGEQSVVTQLSLKPEFNLTLLASSDYIGPLVLVRADLYKALGGVNSEFGSARVFEFILRALDYGAFIDRIPEVLGAYRGARPQSDLSLRKRALAKSQVFGRLAVEENHASGKLALRGAFTSFPPVTVLIKRSLSEGEAEHDASSLQRLLDCLEDTDWPADKLEVIVEGTAPVDLGQTSLAVKWLDAEPQPDAESSAWNKLWRAASNEMLVLLEADVEIADPHWLRALMSFAMDEGVGGVGGKVLTRQNEIVHAGVVGGLLGPFSCAWRGEPAHVQSYQGWASVQREWSILGGGVFATRKSLLVAAAGVDERFSEPFQTADLCLKLRALGYRMVFNPDAVFWSEGLGDRGRPMTASGLALFLSRWKQWLRDDPAYHPGLRTDRGAVRPAALPQAWFI